MSEAEIHGDYELETGRVIVETFTKENLNPDSMPGVLVHSHGPFAWGKDPFEAVHNAVVMEECAAMAFVSVMLQNGSVQPMQQILLDKHFSRLTQCAGWISTPPTRFTTCLLYTSGYRAGAHPRHAGRFILRKADGCEQRPLSG